jgi:hypothetical protein
MIIDEEGVVHELIFESDREREVKYMSRRKEKRRVNWETHLFAGWRKIINS